MLLLPPRLPMLILVLLLVLLMFEEECGCLGRARRVQPVPVAAGKSPTGVRGLIADRSSTRSMPRSWRFALRLSRLAPWVVCSTVKPSLASMFPCCVGGPLAIESGVGGRDELS